MKKLKLIFLLSISILTFGISNASPTSKEGSAEIIQKIHPVNGATRYVWATTLRLRAKPTFDSKVIAGIPYGAAVKIYTSNSPNKKTAVKILEGDHSASKNGKSTVKKQIGDHTTFYYGNSRLKVVKPSFYMEDTWVKVKYKNFVGYVFNGYLSRLNPYKTCEDCSKKPEDFIQNLIDLDTDKIKLDSVSYNGSGSVAFASFNKGNIVFTKDEITDIESIKFKGFSYNEVVLVVLQIYEAARFEGKSSDGLLFKKDQPSEKVKIVKQGDFIVVSDVN